MKYENIVTGKFINRPNRFISVVEIDGKTEKAHVKNTGRLGELLKEGAEVYLEDHAGRMGSRKLRYSLIGVLKPSEGGGILVNIDSQAPNKVVKEALEQKRIVPCDAAGISHVKAEYKYGSSRLDFYAEEISGGKILMEVKGVTLEKGGTAAFPDAPTERGIKHIEELISAVEQGFKACIIFVIQMKGVSAFKPNYDTHRKFGEALVRAGESGVEILAYDCKVKKDSIRLDKPVPVVLEEC